MCQNIEGTYYVKIKALQLHQKLKVQTALMAFKTNVTNDLQYSTQIHQQGKEMYFLKTRNYI